MASTEANNAVWKPQTSVDLSLKVVRFKNKFAYRENEQIFYFVQSEQLNI